MSTFFVDNNSSTKFFFVDSFFFVEKSGNPRKLHLSFFLNLYIFHKDELIDVVSDHESKIKEIRLDYEKQLNALRSEIIRLKDEVRIFSIF